MQSAKPTHGTKGLVTPAINNAALTLLRNVAVTGYHIGIVVNEHTDGDHIILGCNIHGLEFSTAHPASRLSASTPAASTAADDDWDEPF